MDVKAIVYLKERHIRRIVPALTTAEIKYNAGDNAGISAQLTHSLLIHPEAAPGYSLSRREELGRSKAKDDKEIKKCQNASTTQSLSLGRQQLPMTERVRHQNSHNIPRLSSTSTGILELELLE